MAGLLDRYRPSLYAAAIGLLRNRDDAGDAVQDTCATAIVRLSSLHDPNAVGGWLHAVLRNTCLMRLRRAGREAPQASIEPPGVIPATDEIIDGYALREWLWSSIGTLGADDRAT